MTKPLSPPRRLVLPACTIVFLNALAPAASAQSAWILVDDIPIPAPPSSGEPPPSVPTIVGPTTSDSGRYTLEFSIDEPGVQYIVERASASGSFDEVARSSSSQFNDIQTEDGTYSYRVRTLRGHAISLWSPTHIVRVARTPQWVIPDSPISSLPYPATNDNVGTIDGAASVSGGGAAYRIKLDVPPGRRGMAPDVALNYSSRQTDGLAGVGWSISTSSRIHRCQRTPATDEDNLGQGITRAFRGVDYSAEDRLCLDGQRLILFEGTYGNSGSKYRKEIDDKTRIHLISGSIIQATAQFHVRDETGNVRIYGGSASDGYATFQPYGAAAPEHWALRREQDPQTNFIEYDYASSSSQQILLQIRYTGFGTTAGNRRVEFQYEFQPNIRFKYQAGARIAIDRLRLRNVTTYAPSTPGPGTATAVRRYQLSYRASAVTGRSLLASVRDCGQDLGCTNDNAGVPATRFDYHGDSLLTGEAPPFVTERVIPPSIDVGSWYEVQTRQINDLDGDGSRDTIVYLYDGPGVPDDKVLYLTGTSREHGLPFDTLFLGEEANFHKTNWDIDNDGRTDLVGYGLQYITIASYDAAQGGFESLPTNVPSTFQIAHLGDFDGNGRNDFLGEVNGRFHIYLQRDDGAPLRFVGPIEVQPDPDNRYTVTSVADYNGDGLADLFLGNRSGTEYPPHAQILFTQRRPGPSLGFDSHSVPSLGGPNGITSVQRPVMFVDLNGDGLQDIYGLEEDIRINQGGTFTAGTGVVNAHLLSVEPHLRSGILTGDFDGDGSQELLVPTDVVVGYCRTILEDPANNGEPGDYCSYDSGSNHTRFRDASPSFYKENRSIYAWDIVDFSQNDIGNLVISRRPTNLEAPLNMSKADDRNGDGLADVAFEILQIFGRATNGDPVPLGFYQAGKPHDGQYVATVNVRKPDLLFKATNGIGAEALFTYRPLSNWAGAPPSAFADDECLQSDLLSPFYSANLQVPHTPGNHFFSSNMHVVSSFSQSDGLGGLRPTCFKYRDAMFNREGRGFLGFREIVEEEAFRAPNGALDPHNLRTTTTFLQDFPMVDRVDSASTHLVSDPIGTIGISETANRWASDCVDGRESARARSCFIYEIQNIESRSDLQQRSLNISTTTTDFGYDGDDLTYRNLSRRYVTTEDAFTEHRSTETFEYNYDDAGAGWTNRLVQKSTTAQVVRYKDGLTPSWDLNNQKRVITDYEWYGLNTPERRLLRTEVTQNPIYGYPGFEDQERRKDQQYDQYGNVTLTAESGAHMAARQTVSGYTSDGYFELFTTNPVGHVVQRSWDPQLGQVSQEIDPNGLETNFVYERRLNVLDTVDNPKEQPRRTRYQWCTSSGVSCPADTVYRVMEVQDGHAEIARYFDVLGRMRKEELTAFDGVRKITRVTDFDRRGRPTRESQPSFNANGAFFTTYHDYDALGRPGRRVVDRSTESAAHSTLEFVYAYAGLQTNISIQGTLQASRTIDARGQLMETVDTMRGRTRFAHDGLGNVVLIEDAAGNTTTSRYDDLSQRIWIDDPDRGRSSFTYNAMGEVVELIDANQSAQQSSIQTSYDRIGRPIERRVGTDVKARWTYDPNGAKGQLWTEEAFGDIPIRRTYSYDALARKTKLEETITSQTLVTQFGYDSVTGRQKGIKTPSGLFVGEHFTPHGYPLQTFSPVDADQIQVYRRVHDIDARGNVVDAELGNGLRQQRFFHASTGQLALVCVTPADEACDPSAASGRELQRIEYVFDDPYGNLTMELDTVHSAQESYLYDDLQRLTASSRSWARNPEASPQVVNYRYDAVGNILQKDDYGAPGPTDSYVYGSASRAIGNAGPHAVRQVTKPGGVVVTFSYDANGNQIQGDGRTISYTYANLPESINGNESIFRYGPNNRRFYQRDGDRYKLYTEGFERIFVGGTATHRNYIGTFAILTTADGGETSLQYIHRDRLGSVDTITDELGAVIEEHNFDPFGAPRAGDMSDNGALLASSVTDRGFTDHEHLDSHRLIHMNGRLYDPLLGRFLSVDPIVQQTNSNGLNPYSYLMNNPLMGTDPTGYSWASTALDIGIGMIPVLGTAKDIVDTVNTLNDPNASNTAKAVQVASTLAGVVPGVGALAKAGLKLFGKAALKTAARATKNIAEEAGQKLARIRSPSGSAPTPSASKAAPSAPNSSASPKPDAKSGGSSNVAGDNAAAKAPDKVSADGPGKCFVAGTLIAMATIAMPIEAVAVGDRVMTSQGSSETQVDDTWRVVHATIYDDVDGQAAQVELLRPPGWFAVNNVAALGDALYLELSELGVKGWGRVTALAPAPKLATGQGRVVLSTTSQLSNDVYEVSFVEGGETLRGTGAHPLYSLDRDDWVRIRDLQVGERLQTAEGAVTVEALEKVRSEHRVYNLEVEGNHEYLVGETGVRAHNGCVEHFDDFDKARESAFRSADLKPDEISFDPSKATYDPVTGTIVEFKGPKGKKVAYDSPHADMDANAGHDKPHVGWQTSGKGSRRSRGNNTYDGTQHPHRPDTKDD